MRNLNSLTVPKEGESLIVSKKSRKGDPSALERLLSHVRGFGCVENEVLSTYGKSAQYTKSGPIALTKKN